MQFLREGCNLLKPHKIAHQNLNTNHCKSSQKNRFFFEENTFRPNNTKNQKINSNLHSEHQSIEKQHNTKQLKISLKAYKKKDSQFEKIKIKQNQDSQTFLNTNIKTLYNCKSQKVLPSYAKINVSSPINKNLNPQINTGHCNNNQSKGQSIITFKNYPITTSKKIFKQQKPLDSYHSIYTKPIILSPNLKNQLEFYKEKSHTIILNKNPICLNKDPFISQKSTVDMGIQSLLKNSPKNLLVQNKLDVSQLRTTFAHRQINRQYPQKYKISPKLNATVKSVEKLNPTQQTTQNKSNTFKPWNIIQGKSTQIKFNQKIPNKKNQKLTSQIQQKDFSDQKLKNVSSKTLYQTISSPYKKMVPLIKNLFSNESQTCNQISSPLSPKLAQSQVDGDNSSDQQTTSVVLYDLADRMKKINFKKMQNPLKIQKETRQFLTFKDSKINSTFVDDNKSKIINSNTSLEFDLPRQSLQSFTSLQADLNKANSIYENKNQNDYLSNNNRAHFPQY